MLIWSLNGVICSRITHQTSVFCDVELTKSVQWFCSTKVNMIPVAAGTLITSNFSFKDFIWYMSSAAFQLIWGHFFQSDTQYTIQRPHSKWHGQWWSGHCIHEYFGHLENINFHRKAHGNFEFSSLHLNSKYNFVRKPSVECCFDYGWCILYSNEGFWFSFQKFH